MLNIILDRKNRSRLIKMHPVLRRSFLITNPKDTEISDQEFYLIYANGIFTTNWFSIENARLWLRAFKLDRQKIRNVLEIGSWEGRSTIFLAWLFYNAQITCIDSFEGGDEHRRGEFENTKLSDVEQRFLKNTSHFNERLNIAKGRSSERLIVLATTSQKFDFIYVDGSHFYDDVMIDTILSWKLLANGGFLVWDDYFWSMKKVYGKLNPRLAIDQFLTAYRGKYQVIFSGPQVAIRKL